MEKHALNLETPILIADDAQAALAQCAAYLGWRVVPISDLEDGRLRAGEPRLHVAVFEVDAETDPQAARKHFPHALLVGHSADSAEEVDFTFQRNFPQPVFEEFLRTAEIAWRKSLKVFELVKDVAMRRQRMHQLNEISLALTAEMPQQDLMKTILSEAQRIARCEGGSLYLVEKDSDGQEYLVFKLAQNSVVDFPVVETRMPLTSESIAGYAAVTGHELNIEDVYRIGEEAPYRFNRSFDEKVGYRTQSMLTLPMRDHRERVQLTR